MNSENCLNAPLLRWGQQASLQHPSQGSYTSFPAEAFSREQTQVRAALASNEKHTESFPLFYFLSLPSQIKGRPPEYFLLSLDRRCWVSSPAQSQDLEVREKSEASGQGMPLVLASLVLLTSSPPLKTQVTAVQPQHCLLPHGALTGAAS